MTLAQVTIGIARGFVGIREHGRNRGPFIDDFVREAGGDPEDAPSWCAAFVYFCANRGALACKVRCPLKRTMSVHAMFEAGAARGLRVDRPMPGDIGFADHGGGKGHCWFVTDVAGTHHLTIEGNTNDHGSREGDGVLQHMRRPEEATLGYLRLLETPEENNGP